MTVANVIPCGATERGEMSLARDLSTIFRYEGLVWEKILVIVECSSNCFQNSVEWAVFVF